MPDNNRSVDPHPGTDEAKLPTAMSGLVEIHKVHINDGPGDILVALGVKMDERFLQDL